MILTNERSFDNLNSDVNMMGLLLGTEWSSELSEARLRQMVVMYVWEKTKTDHTNRECGKELSETRRHRQLMNTLWSLEHERLRLLTNELGPTYSLTWLGVACEAKKEWTKTVDGKGRLLAG